MKGVEAKYFEFALGRKVKDFNTQKKAQKKVKKICKISKKKNIYECKHLNDKLEKIDLGMF